MDCLIQIIKKGDRNCKDDFKISKTEVGFELHGNQATLKKVHCYLCIKMASFCLGPGWY